MRRTPNHRRRGSISLITVIAIVLLTALSAAMLATMASHQDEVSTANEDMRAFYAAEAGVSAALHALRTTEEPTFTASTMVASSASVGPTAPGQGPVSP